MPVRPITSDGLVTELAETITALPSDGWSRVLVDGAPPSGAGELADALVDPVRARGRAVLRVRAGDFLRPASLRFERGRTDPDAYYDDRLDVGALRREVLGPLEAGGTGRVLPALWDEVTDRAARVGYTTLAAGGVLVVDGSLLLGRGLPAELTVHLLLSPGALARRTPEAEGWTLPAYARYEREVAPADTADVVVRVDHPAHPAIMHNRAHR